MKYIITENRLDDIIQNFITTLIGENFRIQIISETEIYIISENNVVVFDANPYYNNVYVDLSIWLPVRNMFKLEYSETKHQFKNWLDNHQNVFSSNSKTYFTPNTNLKL